MKLLVDMNLPPSWVDFLRGEGIDAVHWSEVGEPTAPDAALMRYAASNGHWVLTHDLDFGAILAVTRGDEPSVVQLRSDEVRPAFIGRRVVSALSRFQAELEQGALVTLDLERTRARLLPLA